MKDEIKEIIESSRKIIKSNRENEFDRIIMLGDDIDKLFDYITDLQDTLIDKQECINAYDEIIKHRDKEITDLKKKMLEILKGDEKMAKWNKKLEWYAFVEDINSRELEKINVIRGNLIDRIKKGVKTKDYALNKKIETLKELRELVATELMHDFWAKAEYEVIVTSLFYNPEKDKKHKIDVWYQLEPNLDRIVEYINREMELGLK